MSLKGQKTKLNHFLVMIFAKVSLPRRQPNLSALPFQTKLRQNRKYAFYAFTSLSRAGQVGVGGRWWVGLETQVLVIRNVL